jgi:hypothetical protein
MAVQQDIAVRCLIQRMANLHQKDSLLASMAALPRADARKEGSKEGDNPLRRTPEASSGEGCPAPGPSERRGEVDVGTGRSWGP